MFLQLKGVIDLMTLGIKEFRRFKSDDERKKTILGVLEAYFVLKDCVDDGEELAREAGTDPVELIKRMEPTEAITTLERWDLVLRKQGLRLHWLQGYIFGQDHLIVINPKLQERISKVIGGKMGRTVTLYSIGAGLYFRNLFPIRETDKEKAELVALMAGAKKDGILNLKKINAELAALRVSLDEYSGVVERLVTSEELLALSTEAREKTRSKP